MGARKRIAADKAKEARKSIAFASLQDVPTSPRKMRLVADMIRGKEVNLALDMLKFSTKKLHVVLKNYCCLQSQTGKKKNQGVRMEDANLVVKTIFVDSGRMLKRLRPAPQGRAHRIRKRSNHVTIHVDSKVSNEK